MSKNIKNLSGGMLLRELLGADILDFDADQYALFSELDRRLHLLEPLGVSARTHVEYVKELDQDFSNHGKRDLEERVARAREALMFAETTRGDLFREIWEHYNEWNKEEPDEKLLEEPQTSR